MSSDARAVLLDVDGTLVDSNDLHAFAWLAALDRYGYRVAFARVRRLIGMGGDKLLPEVTGLPKDSPELEPIGKACKEEFMSRFLPEVHAFPRARALLERLKADGYRLAVASSAGQAQLHAILERAGLKDLIEVETNADDADHSKPDPDIMQATLAKLGMRPEQAIMLGDTPYDVEAARHSGVPMVAVCSGGFDRTELADALAVYASPADLLAHYLESPFARAVRRAWPRVQPS
jgi:HAD superfamily hydrolase (TIGR01509 family)